MAWIIQIRRATTAAMLLLLASVGCGGYGPVSSESYEYAKALYSVTNRQAGDKLVEMESQIDDAATANEISAKESAWLKAIIADAQQGDWKTANKACRQMMMDQVE